MSFFSIAANMLIIHVMNQTFSVLTIRHSRLERTIIAQTIKKPTHSALITPPPVSVQSQMCQPRTSQPNQFIQHHQFIISKTHSPKFRIVRKGAFFNTRNLVVSEQNCLDFSKVDKTRLFHGFYFVE